MKFIVEKIKRSFFYRQHPDTALRYLPMVNILRNNNLMDGRILEVGSGSYGIAPYLRRQIVGLDLSFEEPQFELLKQVKGSGDKIPFENLEFDVVILSDVLEHMPVGNRLTVLKECMRVCKKVLIIGGPFGKRAFKQDLKLAKLSNHHFFKDHLRFGLPEVEDVVKYLESIKSVRKIEKYGDFLNLKARYFLMRLFCSKHRLVYYFYLKGMMIFVPLLRLMNKKPCYRSIIIAYR